MVVARLSGASQAVWTSRDAHRFVILGRSKERSDAAQTLGSMPRRLSAATVQVLLRCIPRSRSRHGSQGLRDAAPRLLRPGMTKVGTLRSITTACANVRYGAASAPNPGPSA
ncbi:hypothetical protein FJ955_11815 [Mesorhizobium sp. B2-2-2]|nr:hypothetical protein FJ955_11815 [Mesorhizobium sp. B2-2-2]